MQDIKREILEIMDQSQTTRCVSRFEPLLYVPVFTQKDYMSTQDLPHREPPLRIWQKQTKSIQLLSNKKPLHKRLGTTIITSHKRDKALRQNSTTITSTQEG